MPNNVIPGLKLIRFNIKKLNLPDDTSLPFKLEASFRPTWFAKMAFIGLPGGREEIVVRGATLETLRRFVEVNGLGTHARLLRLTISGPEGIIEQLPQG